MKRLIIVLMAVCIFVCLASQVRAADDPGLDEVRAYTGLIKASLEGDASAAKKLDAFLVVKNQYGNAVGMLPPVSSLPSVSLPAMPVDAVRPSRPAAPQSPPAARQPPAPPAPASPQAPKPPTETVAKVSNSSPRNYPKGEVANDQSKRLYLAGQPVGEVRVLKGRLKGELVNVDQNNLHIHIWPGSYLSKIAIPVDRGQYKIAYATGKGWVILPEKTNRIPAGCESVRIGD